MRKQQQQPRCHLSQIQGVNLKSGIPELASSLIYIKKIAQVNLAIDYLLITGPIGRINILIHQKIFLDLINISIFSMNVWLAQKFPFAQLHSNVKHQVQRLDVLMRHSVPFIWRLRVNCQIPKFPKGT